MNYTPFFIAAIGVLGSIVVALIGYIFLWKKTAAETEEKRALKKKIEVETVQLGVETTQEALEAMSAAQNLVISLTGDNLQTKRELLETKDKLSQLEVKQAEDTKRNAEIAAVNAAEIARITTEHKQCREEIADLQQRLSSVEEQTQKK